MNIDEILAMRKEIDDAKSEIDSCSDKLYDVVEDLREKLLEIEDECQKMKREQSRQEFDQWIQHGFTLGTKFKLEGEGLLKGTLTVIGISSDGFVAKHDSTGREYTLSKGNLKIIDRFKVVR